MRRFLATTAIVLIGFGLAGTTANARDYPSSDAVLNADKSAVIATAANPSDQSYSCMIEGRIRVTGQRAFSRLQCTFNLPANTPERQVCVQQGNGPGSLSSIEGVKSVCVPN